MNTQNNQLRKEILDIQNDKVAWKYLVDVCKWVRDRQNTIEYDHIPFESNKEYHYKGQYESRLLITRLGTVNSDKLINWKHMSINNESNQYPNAMWCTPMYKGKSEIDTIYERKPLYWKSNNDNKRLVYSSFDNASIYNLKGYVGFQNTVQLRGNDVELDMNESFDTGSLKITRGELLELFGSDYLYSTYSADKYPFVEKYGLYYDYFMDGNNPETKVDLLILLSFEEIKMIASM